MRPTPANIDHSIEYPELFFTELGNLHDGEILNLRWRITHREVELTIDDMYANFAGTAEQMATQAIQLLFREVCLFTIDVSPDKYSSRIMDFEVTKASDNSFDIAVTLSPSGSMRFKCASIACGPLSIPT